MKEGLTEQEKVVLEATASVWQDGLLVELTQIFGIDPEWCNWQHAALWMQRL